MKIALYLLPVTSTFFCYLYGGGYLAFLVGFSWVVFLFIGFSIYKASENRDEI